MKIGFIGLGSMGKAMAGNLIRAGHELTVWNRSSGPVEELAAMGAKAARSPDRAAQGDVVLSMLANDQAMREVFVDGGVLEAMDPGLIHINCATVSVALTRELIALHAARKVGYVAAPVFGRPEVAAAGKVNMLVSGDSASVGKVTPLLEQMAVKLWPLGEDPVRATIAKIAGNMMLAAAIESMAEATTLTRAYGVSATELLEIMNNTLFASPAYQNYGRMIAEQRFEPAGFAMALGHKDIGLALAAGDGEKVPLPMASLLRDALTEALAAGEGKLDLSGLSQVAARRARLEQRGQ